MRLNKKSIPLLCGFALLVLAFSTRNNTAAQNSAPAENDIFSGKIVTVYLDDPLTGSGQVMKDARLEKIADRWMIIGTAISTGQDGEWDEGLTTGIAWDAVTAFYVFTQAQFDEKMKNAGR